MKGRRDMEIHSLLLAADERAGTMADQLAESIHYRVAIAIVERLCAGESADSVASEYADSDAFVGGAAEAIRELQASTPTPSAGQSTPWDRNPGSVDAAGGTCPECDVGGCTAPEPSEPVSDDELQRWDEQYQPMFRTEEPALEVRRIRRLITDLRLWQQGSAERDLIIEALQTDLRQARARIAELEAESALCPAAAGTRDQIATFIRENEILREERDRLEAANETLIRNEQRQEQQHEEQIATLTREKNTLQGAFEAMKVERDEAIARRDQARQARDMNKSFLDKAHAERDEERAAAGAAAQICAELRARAEKAEAETKRLRIELQAAMETIASADRDRAEGVRLREALERMDDAASLLCAAAARRANIYCDESETGELLSARAACISASHIARAALAKPEGGDDGK